MLTDVAREEWAAWRTMCTMLKAEGIDVNDPKHEGLVWVIRHHAELHHRLYTGDFRGSYSAMDDAQVARTLYDQVLNQG
jgi:hypothetical protein